MSILLTAGISIGSSLIINGIFYYISTSKNEDDIREIHSETIRKIVEEEVMIYAKDTIYKFDEIKSLIAKNYTTKAEYVKLKEEVDTLYEAVNKIAMK